MHEAPAFSPAIYQSRQDRARGRGASYLGSEDWFSSVLVCGASYLVSLDDTLLSDRPTTASGNPRSVSYSPSLANSTSKSSRPVTPRHFSRGVSRPFHDRLALATLWLQMEEPSLSLWSS
jgi:hypothetical protein